jgi:hypothetical protein
LWGTYREYFRGSSKVYMYERKYADKEQGREERILVICSFSTQEVHYPAPRGFNMAKGKLILDNYISEEEMKTAPAEKTGAGIPGKLHPYEVQVWKFRKRLQPQENRQ